MLGLLPNLLMLPTAIWGPRALFRIEYIIVAIAARYASRTLVAVLLGITLLLDLLYTFAPVFNFTNDQIVDAARQLANFQGRTTWAAILLLLIVAAVAALLARFGTRDVAARRADRRPLAVAAAVVALILTVDIANGTGAVLAREPSVPIDVASSLASEYAAGATDAPAIGARIGAATDSLRAAAALGHWRGPDKVVLIVVESMGYPRGVADSALFAPFLSRAVASRFDVRTGTLPFTGGTTAGELRELCGVNTWFERVRAGHVPSDCLPTTLARHGFETLAWHGYSGDMFERRAWWPTIGFDRMAFDSDFDHPRPMARCGALFHGICDSSMVGALRAELTKDPERRQFIYWLTLTSHFPIVPNSGAPDVCARLGEAGRNAQVCDLWSSLWPVLDGVAALAADSTVPPAWYVIVGDHAPPRLLSEFPSRLAGRDSTGVASGPRRFFGDRRRWVAEEVALVELRPRQR